MKKIIVDKFRNKIEEIKEVNELYDDEVCLLVETLDNDRCEICKDDIEEVIANIDNAIDEIQDNLYRLDFSAVEEYVGVFVCDIIDIANEKEEELIYLKEVLEKIIDGNFDNEDLDYDPVIYALFEIIHGLLNGF